MALLAIILMPCLPVVHLVFRTCSVLSRQTALGDRYKYAQATFEGTIAIPGRPDTAN